MERGCVSETSRSRSECRSALNSRNLPGYAKRLQLGFATAALPELNSLRPRLLRQ
jgi:hypothetical protein